MKKLMIYPLNKKNTFLVRYRDLLTDYILTAALIEKGIGLDERDCSALDRYQVANFDLSENFEDKLDKCDTVLFLEDKGINLETYIKKINFVVASGKEIIITKRLHNILKNANLKIDDNVVILQDNEELLPQDTNYLEKLIKLGLKQINVPVILIYGLGENCRKFDTQLAVKQFFLNKGISILQYGSQSLSKLFGFQALPNFLFEKKYSMEEKIYLLNDYLYNEVNNSKCEVLILGVPGGILPINQKITNHFGEMALVISNAVSADIAILNMYYINNINKNYFYRLRENSIHRLNTQINYFALVNICTFNDEDDSNELKYISFENEKMIKDIYIKFDKFKLNVFPLYDNLQKEAFEAIYNELSENIEIV